METTFFSLASKSNFNKALRHFTNVTEIVDEVESDKNLADVVNDLIEDDSLVTDQILPIVWAVIRDKYGYSFNSYAIPHTINDFSKISTETAKWTALEIVLVYYSPTGKVFLINPKNINHWNKLNDLSKDQLIVLYAKFLKEDNEKIEMAAIKSIEEMIAGKDVFINKEFIDVTKTPKAVAQKAPQQNNKKVSRSVTPKLGVQVSNELFHNGNVEAWKKIIESYNTKFPELEVSVFFDGELINDLNALFKWGKVKHADSIFFQVGGEEIKGVSKLKKYLYEGASHRYEQFLKLGVGQVLNLF